MGHDPCGFTGDCMLELLSGSEGRKHTGQTGGAADLDEGLASWVAVSWIVQTTTYKGFEVSGVLQPKILEDSVFVLGDFWPSNLEVVETFQRDNRRRASQNLYSV